MGAGLVGEVVLDLGPVAPLRLLAVVLKVEPQLAHLPLVLGLEITCLGVFFSIVSFSASFLFQAIIWWFAARASGFRKNRRFF